MINFSIAENVQDKNTLILLIDELIRDYKNNPDDWENTNLKLYLNGMAGWILDFEGAYKKLKINIPKNINWKSIAKIIINPNNYKNSFKYELKCIKNKEDLSELLNESNILVSQSIDMFLTSIKDYLNWTKEDLKDINWKLLGDILKAGIVYE
jgi:hypothetical protein